MTENGKPTTLRKLLRDLRDINYRIEHAGKPGEVNLIWETPDGNWQTELLAGTTKWERKALQANAE